MHPLSRTIFASMVAVASIALSGCLGNSTPQVQEFWGNSEDASKKVQAVVSQVKCELARAIYRLRHDPSSGSNKPQLDFLDRWGVQVILVLSIDEKSALSPGVSVIAPLRTLTTTFDLGSTVTSAQSFAGNIGGVYSNEAIAVDRTTLFYLVKQLNYFSYANIGCKPKATKATLFEQSDLGIYDWLLRNINIDQFQNADLDLGHIDNVLSHDVKFDIVTSANLTPTWKLVRFTGNTTSPLFLASRDRYQELIITMGKANKVGGGFSTAASESSLAAQIGSAFQSTNVRN